MGLQARVGVRGQHLAVRVDVDTAPVGLLEQLVEVVEVVAGDDDERAGLDREGDLGGDGRPERAHVALVEQAHAHDVDGAGLEHEGEQIVGGQVVAERLEGVHDKDVDLVVGRLAEHARMVCVGGDAAQPEQQQRLERADVLRRVPHLPQVELADRLPRPLGGVGRLGAHLPGEGADVVPVEVDVGQGGEQRVLDERRGVVAHGAVPLGAPGARQPHERTRQLVLQQRDVGGLAARAGLPGAAASPGGLLALEAEHRGGRRGAARAHVVVAIHGVPRSLDKSNRPSGPSQGRPMPAAMPKAEKRLSGSGIECLL